jgi:hypothetical protein
VSGHSFFCLLSAISAQLNVCLLTTAVLDLPTALSYAGKTVRVCAFFCLTTQAVVLMSADKTGRERGDLSISFSNNYATNKDGKKSVSGASHTLGGMLIN